VTRIPVTRLNHAVLYVRDLDRSSDFYQKAFGFEEIAREGGAMASCVPPDRPTPRFGPDGGRSGCAVVLRALCGSLSPAWEVPTIEDLAAAASVLSELGALTGMSDHGATKSLYGRDPDGIEFEIMCWCLGTSGGSTSTGPWCCRWTSGKRWSGSAGRSRRISKGRLRGANRCYHGKVMDRLEAKGGVLAMVGSL